MKYLLYLRDGRVKKFPLNKENILLGRDPTCDFFIGKVFVSKTHARIQCFEDYLMVEDSNSKNGIYKDHLKIKRARINPNESFKIGELEFYLKDGNPEEFIISEETLPVIKKLSTYITAPTEKTKTCLNLFDKTLLTVLQQGFKKNDFHEIFQWAKDSLSCSLKTGQLYLIRITNHNIQLISSLTLDDDTAVTLPEINLEQAILNRQTLNQPIGNGCSFYSFPILLSGIPGMLLYTRSSRRALQAETIQFLEDFSKEIAFIYRLTHMNSSAAPTPGSENVSHPIVSRNPTMLNLLNRCKKIAQSELFTLIEGETGTGKELVARVIHHHSQKNKEKYVGLNCSSIPDSLLEDELFGHEKGAFTGADRLKVGKLEYASGGTLVLDEIGEMPMNLQAKLLRVLQENEFYRLGGNNNINVKLRIISLTNQNLTALIEQKRFREDLYYRIAQVKIKIPPLRERTEDIIPLINHFIETFSIQNRIYIGGVSQQTIDAMRLYPWPGNVRELESEIKSLVSQSNSGDMIDVSLLKEEIQSHYFNRKCDTEESNHLEKDRIVSLLAENKWNKSRVAKELNISRTALYKKLKKFNID